MSATPHSSNATNDRRALRKTLCALLAAAAALAVTLAASCGDQLFMPETGLPEDGPVLRATPMGTIQHLYRAYEDKRIDLFTELLPKDGSYRFFISPEYSPSYTGTDAILTRVEEGQYNYVRPGNYHYWGQESELAKHRNMFRKADIIEFREQPITDERDFIYTITKEGDTTHVEIRMTAGELCIGRDRDTLYCTQKEAQMQVFFLAREADRRTGERLWIIKDWFDLNYL